MASDVREPEDRGLKHLLGHMKRLTQAVASAPNRYSVDLVRPTLAPDAMVSICRLISWAVAAYYNGHEAEWLKRLLKAA